MEPANKRQKKERRSGSYRRKPEDDEPNTKFRELLFAGVVVDEITLTRANEAGSIIYQALHFRYQTITWNIWQYLDCASERIHLKHMNIPSLLRTGIIILKDVVLPAAEHLPASFWITGAILFAHAASALWKQRNRIILVLMRKVLTRKVLMRSIKTLDHYVTKLFEKCAWTEAIKMLWYAGDLFNYMHKVTSRLTGSTTNVFYTHSSSLSQRDSMLKSKLEALTLV